MANASRCHCCSFKEATKGSDQKQKEEEKEMKRPHPPPTSKKTLLSTNPPPFPPPPCDHNITKTFMPLLGKSPGKITLYKY